MNIVIKFSGLAANDVAGGVPPEGMSINLPDGATVKDIFDFFNLPLKKGHVAIIHNKVASPLDSLKDGMVVHIFHAVYGG